MAKGKKTGGGSRAGSPNLAGVKRKEAWETLVAMGYDPDQVSLGVLAMASMNVMPCGVCNGTGKTRFQPGQSAGGSSERTCQSCWGSKMERIDPKDRARAAGELSKYLHRQLKAVELSGNDEKPPVGVRVVVVKAGND